MKYTETHEWVKVDQQGVATVGVTEHAQSELGDIVYVELPQVGASVNKGQEVVVLESTKAAADVYSPVSGTIKSVNTALADAPEVINTSPTTSGWLFTVKVKDTSELESLLTAEQYHRMIGK